MNRIRDLLYDFHVYSQGPHQTGYLDDEFSWLPIECRMVLVAANRKETEFTAKLTRVAANLAMWMAQVETGQQAVAWQGDKYATTEAVYAAVVKPLEKAKKAKPVAAATKGGDE